MENTKEKVEKEVTKKATKEKVKKKVEIEIPDGFTKKTNLNKKSYGYYDGRKYQILKNGMGMWADNGKAFYLDDLK